MLRTLTTIQKPTKYGYTIISQYIQDKHDQGGVTYERRTFERWKDGHITYPLTEPKSYQCFKNKEDGNRDYLFYKGQGFVYVSRETFVPTELDMR